MIAGLMLLVAYILPIPIMVACFYFNVFAFVDGTIPRLIAIAVASLAPSALIMLFALKRILHMIFNVICVAAATFALHYFGLLNLAAK